VEQGGWGATLKGTKIGGGGHFWVKNQICWSVIICIATHVPLTHTRGVGMGWGLALSSSSENRVTTRKSRSNGSL